MSSSRHEDRSQLPPSAMQQEAFVGSQQALEQVLLPPQPRTDALVSAPLIPVDVTTSTKKLTLSRTSTRLPTVIPATEKRVRVISSISISTAPAPIQVAPRRRRRATLVSILVSCLTVIVALALFISPLDNGQSQGVLQSLGTFIQQNSTLAAFGPAAQPVTPTPTPDLMSGEGYCGGTDIWGTCATAVTASGVMGTGVMQKPILGAVITQPFAHPEYQTWCGCIRPHSGIDLAAPYGTAIMAADSGQVIWVGWDWSGLGWAVKINHGHYIATIYGHLDHYIVKVGQNVTKGQVIGYEGSTGASTGPHLHFMVMVNNIWVDPTLYVALP